MWIYLVFSLLLTGSLGDRVLITSSMLASHMFELNTVGVELMKRGHDVYQVSDARIRHGGY